MVSPQFSYCPSGNDNHDMETTTPGLGMYGITTVQLLSVRITTTTTMETTTPGLGMYGITTVQLLSVRKRQPRHGNHNSGSWYVWYHHSSVTVRPVTTTTDVRKPQLRVLVCMVSPQFSYCPSGNDHHCVRKPQLRALVCMVSPQFSYCPSGNDHHDMETTTPGLGMYGIITVQLLSVR